MLELRGVSFAYGGRPVLRGISLNIKNGEHVALVGPNASGKSTLAMMMNALLLPDEGECIVDGVSTKDDPYFARRSVGMVFQNPDDQAVSRKVWDDVAFGPRNLGLPSGEAERRVTGALAATGLGQYARRGVSTLSGGQKQLLAIAGVLAMGPSYMVLDEPTSLLDGPGATAVRDVVVSLKNGGVGIVWATHDMEEALMADVVAVLKEGKLLASVPPDVLFSDVRLMAGAGIEAPYTWRVSRQLTGPGEEAVNTAWRW